MGTALVIATIKLNFIQEFVKHDTLKKGRVLLKK